MPPFDYKQFHDYYTQYDNHDLYDIIDDASAIVYTWKAFQGAKEKPTIARTLRQFRYKQIDRLPCLKALSEKHCDIFFILNERSSKCIEDQVFFVFPRHKFDMVTGIRSTHMYADHFSFQFNNDDKNTPVHLHQTQYIPKSDNEATGYILRDFANFKHHLPIEDVCQTVGSAIRDTPMLLDIISQPFSLSGGKAKRVHRAHGSIETYGMFENKTIFEFCRDNNVSQILVTYLRGFVNVAFLKSDDIQFMGFSFEIAREEFTEAEIRRRIIAHITGLRPHAH